MSDKVYFGENGIRKEAKGEVLEQILLDREKWAEEQRLLEAEQLAKEEARKSAMAKLKKLGLTDDEIAALVP